MVYMVSDLNLEDRADVYMDNAVNINVRGVIYYVRRTVFNERQAVCNVGEEIFSEEAKISADRQNFHAVNRVYIVVEDMNCVVAREFFKNL